MTKKEIRLFLAQFPAARRRFATWPKWMRDASHEASASYPKTATHTPAKKGAEHHGD